MATWQRRLRIALGVFILLFTATVYLAMRKPPVAAPSKPFTRIDPNVERQVEKGTRIAYQGGKVDYTVDYDAVLEYTGEATRIRGVKATFLQRNGRDYRVTGDEGV